MVLSIRGNGMNKNVINYGRNANVFDALFDDFGRDFLSRGNMDRYLAPKVDIRENENAYTMEVDLPGLDEKDIDINIKDKVLSLSCKAEKNDEKKGGSYIIKERGSFEFKRSFNFSDNIDEDGITAVFENGVLEVKIPKKEEKKPVQIEVKRKGLSD